VLDPASAQVFHDLFDVFQKLRRPDQSWAAASVANYLGAAEERERFMFEEHRQEGVLNPVRSLQVGGWELLYAADRDRALEAELAFLAGGHLAYHVGPHRLLLYFPSMEELGACFIAAVKLVRPSLPAPAAIEDAVLALIPLLNERLTEEAREALRLAVNDFYK